MTTEPEPEARPEPADDRFPAIQFAHLDNTDTLVGGNEFITRRYYTLYPITIARPDRGRQRASIVCGTCGKTIKCVLYSDEAQHRWKRRRTVRRWTVLSVLTTTLAVLAGVSIARHAFPAKQIFAVVVGLGLAMPGISPVGLWLLRTYPSRADGVRLGWSRRHSLRPAGDTLDVEERSVPEPNI